MATLGYTLGRTWTLHSSKEDENLFNESSRHLIRDEDDSIESCTDSDRADVISDGNTENRKIIQLLIMLLERNYVTFNGRKAFKGNWRHPKGPKYWYS